MKRKYKRRTSRFGIFFVFLTAVTIAGVFFIPWAMKPDNFRNEKNYLIGKYGAIPTLKSIDMFKED